MAIMKAVFPPPPPPPPEEVIVIVFPTGVKVIFDPAAKVTPPHRPFIVVTYGPEILPVAPVAPVDPVVPVVPVVP
jgi:hypothetical protein